MNPPQNNEERPAMPGAALKAAREAKGATLGDVAEATRIKVQIIEAIERDDFSRIAAPTYAKGFIKLYADFAGLDAAPLLSAYAEQHRPGDPRRDSAHQVTAKAAPGTPGSGTSRMPRWIDILPLPRVAARVGIAAGALVVAVLLLAGLIKLVSGAVDTEPAADTPKAPPEADWTLVAEPPDAVLPLPTEDRRAP